jgi:hypothetical protein
VFGSRNRSTKKGSREERETILTDHLKEGIEDLNHLEVEFSQKEIILEEEIISWKIQLE